MALDVLTLQSYSERAHRNCNQSYKLNTIIPAITSLSMNMIRGAPHKKMSQKVGKVQKGGRGGGVRAKNPKVHNSNCGLL